METLEYIVAGAAALAVIALVVRSIRNNLSGGTGALGGGRRGPVNRDTVEK